MENTPSPPPAQVEICADLTHVRLLILMQVEALSAPDAPKSRERSLVITKLEEARLWAGEAMMKE